MFIKKGADRAVRRDVAGREMGVIEGLWNLFRNIWFMLPFALNQAGSLLFYALLG